MRPSLLAIIGTIGAVLIAGCATGNPVSPPGSGPDLSAAQTAVSSGRILWGIWQIEIDPASGTATVVPARFSEFHANVRKFLEEGPCVNCVRVVPPITPTSYGMDVTIAVRHPFPGNTFYHGFDVRGIIMLEGDYSFPNLGFLSTRVASGGWGLVNPDGFTSIFNAVDYTAPGILGYSRGKMVPSAWGNPANTLNAFKAFYSQGQSENDGGRRGLLAGEEVQRTYQIQVVPTAPLKFWYAVDASWVAPTGSEPYDFDDFPPNANCPEAYRFDFSMVTGELFPAGGTATIGVDIWDHQGWTPPYQLKAEAPECSNSLTTISSPPLWTSGDRAHWEFDLTNQLGGLDPATGTELVLVAVNNDDDPLTGPIDGVGRFTVPVAAGPTPPVVYSIVPNSGLQGSQIDNAHITGDHFLNGCTARLEKTGQPDIVGTGIVFQDAQNVLADFSLIGAAAGKWDVVVENPGGQTGTLPQGFEVTLPAGCNSALHSNYLGKGDFSGGTNMAALDACFVHDTGQPADGELLGYISGFAGTVVTTYNVDTTTPAPGHGLSGGWGNPHIGSWPTPNSIDISEEMGRFFVVWSDTVAYVEERTYDGTMLNKVDASAGGQVYCLDTDGYAGWWDVFFPQVGFAEGIKHFVPNAIMGFSEATQDAVGIPEAWGHVVEIICIPDDCILILSGLDGGKIRKYDITTHPPTYVDQISNIFGADLAPGTWPQKMCDMETDWSDPAYAHCRIVVWGNLATGGGALVKIDSDLNTLAGPTLVPGVYESLAFNPNTLNVTLWPERKASAGSYALVEKPAGW